ncbi:glycosyltransferase [Aureimonas mangrovi]|uniref:glycosyltransferase n=1 Tax=Aureimonas mangrovi TaxID=2758041 RepID=UPI00163D4AFA|nr:glycosyltransferase [Aureimonas mangrovi]
MRITLVMCTRNRAEQLRRVLDSAAAMRVPEGLAWEFVLVDNGSTDHTREVVESYADRLPIRWVSEPVAGLSNARNRGVAEAKGEYICWTDDDVVIDPEWLAAYAQAFDEHPEAAFFGGVIEPVLEGEQPDWFQENRQALYALLAERDLGADPIALAEEGNRLPYGANYALRGAEQRRHLYDPDLGVSPGQKRLGEEVDVVLKVIGDGGTGIWVPGSRVRHIIPQARQTLDYVRVYQQSAGETWAYLASRRLRNFMGPSLDVERRTIFGVPRWIWREAARHRILFLLRRRGASTIWLDHWRNYAYYRGAIDYLRRQPAANG